MFKQLAGYSFSAISSNAARTAEITKAEKVQSLPFMASSTLAIMSLGKRMVLFVVGGTDGILKFDKQESPRNTIVLRIVCTDDTIKSALQTQCQSVIIHLIEERGLP